MDINKYIKRKLGKKTDAPKTAEEAYEKYSSMSQEDLMQEMFRSAQEGRDSGELTNERLDDFYQQAKGFLSPEQAERMRELIIELKK